MSEEIWLPIRGFPTYQVSSQGRVRSVLSRWPSMNGRILKPKKAGYLGRYVRYSLFLSGKSKEVLAHRLVASHFIGDPPSSRHEAAHLDGNPHNNDFKNILWVLPIENSGHKKIHGTSGKGSKNASAKLQETDVQRIFELFLEGTSLKDISALMSIKVGTLREIVRRRTWKHIHMTEDQESRLKTLRKYWMSTSNQRKKNATLRSGDPMVIS